MTDTIYLICIGIFIGTIITEYFVNSLWIHKGNPDFRTARSIRGKQYYVLTEEEYNEYCELIVKNWG